MTELITTSHNLPANIEDLAKFVLVGREKLIAVKAQIRAIDKLGLAEEVYTQKLEETQMLTEALLDAEVKIGEITKKIPKTAGGDRRSEVFKKCSGAQFESSCINDEQKQQRGAAAINQKSKSEIVENLGFSRDQVKRFETLAANKDVVEQVKAEARENNDLPTRSRVLQLVKQKNAPPPKEENYEFRYQAARSINEAISNACLVKVTQEHLQAWFDSLTVKGEGAFQLNMVNEAIENLRIIKVFLNRKECQK